MQTSKIFNSNSCANFSELDMKIVTSGFNFSNYLNHLIVEKGHNKSLHGKKDKNGG